MAFMDPEQVEAVIRSIEDAYSPFRDELGVSGSVARAVSVVRAFYLWHAAEIGRGTSTEDMAHAGALACGSLIGAIARACAVPGTEHVVTVALLEEASSCAVEMALKGRLIDITLHDGRVS